MRERRSLPIAAHLGLLVALAFVSAFVVMLAVVIWLPPRPPGVMRGDQLIEAFAQGYGEAAQGRLPGNRAMAWRIVAAPPRLDGEPPPRPLRDLSATLAARLLLAPDRVRISADLLRADTFVFRVRGAEHQVELHRERIEQAARIHGEFERRNGEAPIIEHFNTEAPAPPESPEFGAPPAPPEPPLFAPPPPGVVLLSGFDISAQLQDGRWLVMRQGRNWAELSWFGRAALMIGVTFVVLSLLALWFARRLAQPIQNFADAVQAVGVDPQSAPVAERGPEELRGAARAVNTMQTRLRALIADRTKTLATVAHDMRTPLMRMRLVAENVEPAQRERMAKEISEVEALVASFIAFARDDPAEEARVRVDLSALLQSLVDDSAESGRDVTFVGDERFVITGQRLGLKRLFGNLIDNALKYGGAARLELRREDALAIIDVADEGPGIPEADRAGVFEPFVRLSRAESGAGLGLSAARGIARAHGGDIVILDAERGALLRVTLPA